MTVTTSGIDRLTARVKAKIDVLAACAPSYAEEITAAALARLTRDLLGGDGNPATCGHRPGRR